MWSWINLGVVLKYGGFFNDKYRVRFEIVRVFFVSFRFWGVCYKYSGRGIRRELWECGEGVFDFDK